LGAADDGVKALTLGPRRGPVLRCPWVSADFIARLADRAGATVTSDAPYVVFDYDVSRELAGALEIGAKVPPFAMV
jgi:hypothetical protein